MLKEKNNITTPENTRPESQTSKDVTDKEPSIDWAEEASHELSDYIEEQGIYIRY